MRRFGKVATDQGLNPRAKGIEVSVTLVAATKNMSTVAIAAYLACSRANSAIAMDGKNAEVSSGPLT